MTIQFNAPHTLKCAKNNDGDLEDFDMEFEAGDEFQFHGGKVGDTCFTFGPYEENYGYPDAEFWAKVEQI